MLKDARHTEIDKQVTPTLSLSDWQRHNAADVVVLWTSFLFAKIPDKTCTNVVHFSHDIEQKWLDVIEKRFVIEEHFGQQTEVLAVYLARDHQTTMLSGQNP
jgi:hypothetical protein